jgi:2-aminoadipate transaminase
MRELLARTARPGVISFAGGLPANRNLPLEQLRVCLDAVLSRDDGRALQYGPPYAPLQELIAGYMRERGVVCETGDVFITSGNQQGLELVARLLIDPGAVVAVEEYTFTGVMQAALGHGATLAPVAVDLRAGLDLDALEDALRRGVQMLILIPDFHNPLGVSMDAASRVRAAELAARYGVPLVEDDPYSALRFAGEPLPPVKAYDDAGRVFYLGSFSKMVAPALRLGWMIAPRELQPRLTVLRESLDLESSQLVQRTVAEFLARGYLRPHLEQLNAANRERCRLMAGALERALGGQAHWTTPQGGVFIWLVLPGGVDTQLILNTALDAQVAFVPGFAFAAREGAGRSAMRLNFSNATAQGIQEGMERLLAVVRATIDDRFPAEAYRLLAADD